MNRLPCGTVNVDSVEALKKGNGNISHSAWGRSSTPEKEEAENDLSRFSNKDLNQHDQLNGLFYSHALIFTSQLTLHLNQ